MTEIATIDWFGRWGTSVFSENTAKFHLFVFFPPHKTYTQFIQSIFLKQRFKFVVRAAEAGELYFF